MKKVVIAFLISLTAYGQVDQNPDKMQWFEDAKLGIFVHWGYYAVNGITESWSMYHQRIGYEDYMNQGNGFTAEKYDPNSWVELFKRTGARYAVITSKHHDGVALWDTGLSKLNVVDQTPAGSDILTPFVDALKEHGLKVGLYFSLPDWSHPDYEVVFPRPDTRELYPQENQQTWEPWDRYMKFYTSQIEELQNNYNPDLFWFDGDWEHTAEKWRSGILKEKLLDYNPDVIVNSRLNHHGDYSTPEQGVPVVRPEGPWEFCMTMNDNWGYFPSDTNYKPISQIIRTFSTVIGMGGNLLLNVGPKPDGTLVQKQVENLEALGSWIRKHEPAVFDTDAGLPYGHFAGPTTLSKDRTRLYLFLFDKPQHYISLKGIQNKVKSIKVLGTNQELSFVRNGGAQWNNIPGILRIDIPEDGNLDEYVTVLEIQLEKPLVLYRGHGQAVELNL